MGNTASTICGQQRDSKLCCLEEKSKLLDDYIQVLQEQPPHDQWSKAEHLAYWINAYNALTVQLILKYYPQIVYKTFENPGSKLFFA